MKNNKFSHVDNSGNPSMVDVSGKNNSLREARAQAIIEVSPEIMKQINGNELVTKKGPVFQTAIIAGVMGAKKTADLIPLCHPLPVEDCQVRISTQENHIIINTSARITGKTGVEMEALTAATIAALTIYDMCKALSHDIVIKEVKLMEKSGGKNDFKRN
ncbi:cyclic pyranopterin monophosphate synthase MoaC [Chryseosolibacter indicus]|uniref:Cyclic pyranopterin monophosphate synthase MoaC n=1 Tax=Chryseosolibacter indicus TaxID=2782351 RepID=A0ABS5VQ04_9BACT|nr:cyclic pyranopterin monophosphate synthase MoaC [Chryseosolibacter indicus]MBT1703517.1 cyclic pyranopterin monophosphate synthase MoaC [Chryseosolibacter indicus]